MKKFKNFQKKKKINKYVVLIGIIILLVAISFYLFLVRDNKKLNCNDFNVNNCPNKCVICPPCEVCSSISCQTEEYCKNIGFNKDWYDNVNPDKK